MSVNAPMAATEYLQLRDGRRLAYCSHGDARAWPVIWLDGTPGSRLTRGLDPRRLGVRLVTFDRPGYGDSDRWAGRSVADVALDVEQLADHLGFDRWTAVGYSGGGPHALACGAGLADRVDAVALIATVAPPDEFPDGVADGDEAGVDTRAASSANPSVLEHQLRRMRDDLGPDPVAGMTAAFGKGGTDVDHGYLSDRSNREMLNVSLREALRPGHEGWFDDELALQRDWGFALTDVDAPVHFLHGAVDPIAPIADAHEMAAAITSSTFDQVDAVGHLAVLDHVHLLAPTINPTRTHEGDRT